MKSRLANLCYRIGNSIAFYPTVISTAYFALAIMVVTLPSSAFWDSLSPFLSWAKLPRVWNAEVVLSTLITGIISLLALSFAMVMVVLSNVSTTFSPKLILGLVTERTHQVVLGNYIGAILYCLILMLTISNGESHRFHDMAVILAAAMGIWCLVLFIDFIHKISTSVQINNIVEKIYNDTRKELYGKQNAEAGAEFHPQTFVDETITPRYVFPSRTSGYLQRIDTKELIRIAGDHGLVIRIHPYLGDFVVRDSPFLSCTKPLGQIEPSLLNTIYDAFTFFTGEKIQINERYGFTQLMEIAVKALSPGINDPGTACLCIDYLTDLFVSWNTLKNSDVHYDQNRNPRLIVRSFSFEELFNMCIGPIRRYGKEDLLIANKLLRCFKTLSHFDKEKKRYRNLLNDHAISVIEDIRGSSSNANDFSILHGFVMEMNEDSEGYFNLPEVEVHERR